MALLDLQVLHLGGEGGPLRGEALLLALPGVGLFQVVDLLHGTLVQALLNNGLLDFDLQRRGNFGLAEDVGGAASVSALVLGVSVHNVQRDEAEIVALPEPGSLLDGAAVVEPFDAKS